jgi:acetyl-CoA carboxylase carboxyltransferase component
VLVHAGDPFFVRGASLVVVGNGGKFVAVAELHCPFQSHAAITDDDERRAAYEERVARMYEHGKAISMASHFEIDDVIDPAETRTLISNTLRGMPAPPQRTGKKRPMVDTW